MMMGVPWLLIVSLAAVGYLLNMYLAQVNLGMERPSTAQLLVVLACAGLLLRVVWFIFIYPFFVSPLRHLPIPPGKHWLWGHGLMLLKEPRGVPASRWVNTIPNDGVIRFFSFFNSERILVTSPKTMAEVLVTKSYSFQKPAAVRSIFSRFLGRGLAFSEGNEHKIQRRKLLPAFAFRHIKELHPLFWDKTRELVDAMTDECEANKSVKMELYSWASRYSLDIIGLAGLGRDFGAIQDQDRQFPQACRTLFEPPWRAQILAVVAAFIPAWVIHSLPVRANGDISNAAKIIRKMCWDIVRAKARTKVKHDHAQRKDILTIAMDSGIFSEANLTDHAASLLAAGQVTTAGSMAWAGYMLAKDQAMQRRLREEIRSRIQHLDAPISSDDIDAMVHVKAFCKEILRYWCPVPAIARTAAEDIIIGGQPVVRGTDIVIPIWAMNRDPSQWGPDAAEFKPDRWLAGGEEVVEYPNAEGLKRFSNYSFATFSHGPRNCIGQKFAEAELACLLVGWIGMFEFELLDKSLMDESKVEISGGLVARPMPDVGVTVRIVPGFRR